MSENEYRYVAARGVEAREPGRTSWWAVDGDEMSRLSADDFRKIADAMDGGVPSPETVSAKRPFMECTEYKLSGTIKSVPLTFDSPVGGATIQPDVKVAEAPSDEAAAIANERAFVARALRCPHEYNVQAQLSAKGLRHVLAALDRATAQLADARSEAVALRATEENLQARLAAKEADENESFDLLMKERSRAKTSEAELVEKQKYILQLEAEIAQLAARTDATPLGWVNVYGDRAIDVYFHFTEESARLSADGNSKVKRVAVPVYEPPPRPVAPVTDAEIAAAVNRARASTWAMVIPVGDVSMDEYIKEIRPLLNRAAVAPDYELVGACVVRPDNNVAVSWTSGAGWSIDNAIKHAARYGGTAHRLYRGEPITEATP